MFNVHNIKVLCVSVFRTDNQFRGLQRWELNALGNAGGEKLNCKLTVHYPLCNTLYM